MNYKLICITASSKKEARKIVEILIKEKLAACGNIFKIDSIFRWRGKIEKAKEFGIFVKTKRNLVEKIIKKVKEIHSYEIPCLISFDIEKGNEDFLKWIDRELR